MGREMASCTRQPDPAPVLIACPQKFVSFFGLMATKKGTLVVRSPGAISADEGVGEFFSPVKRKDICS